MPVATTGRGWGIGSHNRLAIPAIEIVAFSSRKFGDTRVDAKLMKTQREEYSSRARQNGAIPGGLCRELAWLLMTRQLSGPWLGTVSGAHLSLHLLVPGLLPGPCQLLVSSRELLAQ